MFFRILKKDIKRKKTMNVILLLFVILCSMFASASVNNIIAVTGGIEHYFDVSEVPDLIVAEVGESDFEERLRELPSVKDVKTEHILCAFSSKYFKHKGKKLDNFINPAGLISAGEMALRYFDDDNHIIKDVEKGTFYATKSFLNDTDIKVGDEVELTLGECQLTMKFAGRCKGALFGSDDVSNPHLILNSEDYDYLGTDEAAHIGGQTQFYVNTSDEKAIYSLAEKYDGVYVNRRDDMKTMYLYDMFTAYIMMVISIVLMLTAFVVLRFTIGFTISEEFREIGVMKAVGINNTSIRGLYITKYLAISVIGAVIGFFGSIPLGNMMMKAVSENIVLGTENGGLIGIFSALAVVIIIMLFCYTCTRKVKKLSPIDAVRSGQTGERFRKKSLIHLGRSKLPSTAFLSVNDVISSPKQFSIITIVFSLSLLMIMIMSNFVVTLKSEKILRFFATPPSDAHIFDTEMLGEVFQDQTAYEHLIPDTEKLLADNGMPAKCSMSIMTSYETNHGDKTSKILFCVIKGNIKDELYMDKGYAPRKNDEVAVTVSTMKALDAEIGDKITAVMGDKEYEFTITGTYSSFMSPGAYLYEGFELDHLPSNGSSGLTIKFDGSPDQKTIDKNIKKIKELIESDKVYNTSDMIKTSTGISDTLNSIKKMMMILTVIVTAMIAILMERSFISKEKSEIALMKAIGISNGSIIAQHVLRFVIVSILACGISLAVTMPISNFVMNKICLLIGDISGMKCDFSPIEIFAVCPAIVIGVTLIGSFLTALYTRTIKPSDTTSIE